MTRSSQMPRTVFILGAGANQVLFDEVGTSPPLGNNLFQIAHRQRRFRPELVSRYGALFRYISHYWHKDLASLVGGTFDLEECVSLIDSQIEDPGKRSEEEHLTLVRWLLLSLLGEVLADFRPQPSVEQADAFGYLCGLLRDATVLSFNYDCLVEDYLDRHLPLDDPHRMPYPLVSEEFVDWYKKTFGEGETREAISWEWTSYHRLSRYGFEFDDVFFSPPGTQSAIIPKDVCYRSLPDPENLLLKLHGSLNWARYVARDPTRIWSEGRDVDRTDRVVFASEWAWSRLSWGDEVPRVQGWLVDPVIVAPTWAKDRVFGHASLRRIFSTVWDRATEALSRCERLVVIGYSLPPTDFRTTRLFREAFAAHAPDEVVLVNKTAALADRLKDLTGIHTAVRHFHGIEEFLLANEWDYLLVPERAAGMFAIHHPWTDARLYGFEGWPPQVENRGMGVLHVRWGWKPLPPGWLFDVQVSDPSTKEFSDWLRAIDRPEADYEATGPGTYAFRAKAWKGEHPDRSSWSPSTAIEVDSSNGTNTP